MKNKPVNLISPKDKMPFEVTPLIPYLTRFENKSSATVQAQR